MWVYNCWCGLMGSDVRMPWGWLRWDEGVQGLLDALAWLDLLIGIVVVITRVV